MMSLRLVTLNTWCPPYGRHRDIRALAIAEKLRELSPDVICLQEMFMAAPRRAIMHSLQNEYPHQHYFQSGLLGSGLLTLTKFPIVQTQFHRFRLGGKPEKIKHGDYYVGKGVGLTTLQIAVGKRVNIFNTHTHAQYQPQNDNEYAFFTNTNLFEVTEFIAQNAQYPLILCGDLNTRPDQLGYRLVSSSPHLSDAYSTLYPREKGITYSRNNPYVTESDQRLDYVFTSLQIVPNEVEITFTDLKNATSALAYSDHYGLDATLTIKSFHVEKPITPNNSEALLALAYSDHYGLDATLTIKSFHVEKPTAPTNSEALLALAKEAQRELAFIDAQETQHVQQALVDVFSLWDVHQTLGKAHRIRFLPIRTLQRWLRVIALVRIAYHLLTIVLNLPPRRAVAADYLRSLLAKLPQNH